ncbi:prephenate dehydratase [Neorhodopirellula lusitana]|uniref:prephenate dehydratase n=1 Tax=Neorhodopirellula lusitana TaxID=445327 RepID=UPI00384A6D97
MTHASEPDNSLDSLDRRILELLNQRCQTVAETIQADPTSTLPDAVGQAEARVAVDADLEAAGLPVLSVSSQKSILRHIVSACYQANRPSRVAFLGPVDSYSHLATLAYFGDAIALSPVSSIGAVFESVAASRLGDEGGCDFGVVPIENSTDGRVVDTLGRLAGGDVNLTGEVLMSIHHNLLSSGQRETITEVHSKPQALSQCRRWLADHLPNARLVETASTAAAAEAASKTIGIAAIASLPAATRYGLNVIEASIEDNKDNVTRFAILGSKNPPPTGNDKTTLLFQVEHRPGALADVMGTFKEYRLNLTWIESFPEPGKPNEYFFVVEFPGHRDDSAVANAIKTLAQEIRHVRVLGSYACGRKV